MAARAARQAEFDAGRLPDFLPETQRIRESDWTVAPVPHDLQDRRVEITGPTDRKMVINALNSGANVFMADFEDSNAPTWSNMIEGQVNLRDAVNRTIEYASPEGKHYRLNEKTATLLVRPRGWHLARGARARRRRAGVRSDLRLRACISSTTRRRCSRAAAAPTSTCRRWKATSRRGCGTTSSSPRSASSASRRAPSRPRC